MDVVGPKGGLNFGTAHNTSGTDSLQLTKLNNSDQLALLKRDRSMTHQNLLKAPLPRT